jgi:hypothetical protein
VAALGAALAGAEPAGADELAGADEEPGAPEAAGVSPDGAAVVSPDGGVAGADEDSASPPAGAVELAADASPVLALVPALVPALPAVLVLSGLASAEAARATSPPGLAVRKRRAPLGTISMPRWAARVSTRSPAAISEFSMLSAAFSRCSALPRSSARPMLELSSSSASWSVTIPMSAKATTKIQAFPAVRRSIRR